jgi:mRNA-degrading endonuclease RelE of RelBE toxin-antitoxin system
MAFEILLAPRAVADLRGLDARHRSLLRDAMERHLRVEPRKVSRVSIKRLRGMRKPMYRLRVGEFRVFYDVVDEAVEILAIVGKSNVEDWLVAHGEPE